MSKKVDEILELLDQSTQDSPEAAIHIPRDGACWKCLGPPGDGASGVCDRCREKLLEELPPPAPSAPNTSDGETLGEGWTPDTSRRPLIVRIAEEARRSVDSDFIFDDAHLGDRDPALWRRQEHYHWPGDYPGLFERYEGEGAVRENLYRIGFRGTELEHAVEMMGTLSDAEDNPRRPSLDDYRAAFNRAFTRLFGSLFEDLDRQARQRLWGIADEWRVPDE